MATRGAIEIIVKGKSTYIYNQCDSYLCGLGDEIMTAITDALINNHKVTKNRLIKSLNPFKSSEEWCDWMNSINRELPSDEYMEIISSRPRRWFDKKEKLDYVFYYTINLDEKTLSCRKFDKEILNISFEDMVNVD